MNSSPMAQPANGARNWDDAVARDPVFERGPVFEQDPVFEQGPVFEQDQCWICMESGARDPLASVCACPGKLAHARCIARWQLQSAGKQEERTCRFCMNELPDWRPHLTPPDLKPSRTAVLAVALNGGEHRITVEPGSSGRSQFEKEIRRLFSLTDDDEIDFTFDCQAPGTFGESAVKLVLEGGDAFDAAFHCAAVTAALRARTSP